MAAYDLHEPATVTEATALLGELGDGAVVMAGGASLVLLIREGFVDPAHVVSLRRVDELRGVDTDADGTLRLRALATHQQIATSPLVRTWSAALADAFAAIATVRIRNQGTIGGNIAHADPAQDPPPMLLALDSVAEVHGPRGTRSVAFDDLFVDYFETSLAADELIIAVRVPPVPAGGSVAYTKYLPGSKDDYATVSVGARVVRAEDGTCADIRIGLGSCAVTPVRARAVEDALRGRPLTRDVVREAAAIVDEDIDPLDDVRGTAGYKRAMARVWIERTILRALEGGSR